MEDAFPITAVRNMKTVKSVKVAMPEVLLPLPSYRKKNNFIENGILFLFCLVLENTARSVVNDQRKTSLYVEWSQLFANISCYLKL